jgi:hypothetical protein
MNTYGGVEVKLQAFLTSALDGGEWLASRPGRFDPGEMVRGTHWIGGWGGPQSRSESSGEVKSTFPAPTRNRSPVVQPSCCAD